MRRLQNEILEIEVEEHYSNNSLKIYFSNELKLGICEVIAPYIPLNEFMDGFNKAGKLVGDKNITSFVFDKRSLHTFHQPSMEWYFVQWKPKMKELGLVKHYKILPPEKWFQKCVEAGKKDIIDNYSENFLDGISIEYIGSIEEALGAITAPRIA